MSIRTNRRTVERKLRKLERKNLQAAAAAFATHSAPQTDPNESHLIVASPAPLSPRYESNHANAQFSTGPTSPEGRAISSRNALKHGLTGSTVLLDSDDAAEYQRRLDYYTGLYQPMTFEERRLVQAVHDANWRLDRVTNLESTVFARGRNELEGCFHELPEDQQKSFIELEITRRYAKELHNFHIQEARIQRQRSKDLKALQTIQTERYEAQAEDEAEAAAAQVSESGLTPDTTRSTPNGFVFETAVTPSGHVQLENDQLCVTPRSQATP